MFFDISQTLTPSLATWPGDTLFSLTLNMSRHNSEPVNLTTLTLSAHFGTHMDAPHHFADNARSVDQLELLPYWGSARVVTVAKTDGPLFPADFAHCNLVGAQRLLVHSVASHRDHSRFWNDFVYPSPELADFLGSLGILLYGADAPSMDAADSKTLPGHAALLKNGIAILEGLALTNVPDGDYELVALPLKIAGGDGSPVRAVLRKD